MCITGKTRVSFQVDSIVYCNDKPWDERAYRTYSVHPKDNEILLFGFVTMDEEVESKTYSQPDNALIVCVKPHYPLENIPETDSMLRGCLLCCQDFDT